MDLIDENTRNESWVEEKLKTIQNTQMPYQRSEYFKADMLKSVFEGVLIKK